MAEPDQNTKVWSYPYLESEKVRKRKKLDFQGWPHLLRKAFQSSRESEHSSQPTQAALISDNYCNREVKRAESERALQSRRRHQSEDNNGFKWGQATLKIYSMGARRESVGRRAGTKKSRLAYGTREREAGRSGQSLKWAGGEERRGERGGDENEPHSSSTPSRNEKMQI